MHTSFSWTRTASTVSWPALLSSNPFLPLRNGFVYSPFCWFILRILQSRNFTLESQDWETICIETSYLWHIPNQSGSWHLRKLCWENPWQRSHGQYNEHRCLMIVFPLLADYGPFPESKITWILSGFQTCQSFKHKCMPLIPSEQTGCWLFYEEMQHHQTWMLFFRSSCICIRKQSYITRVCF